MSVAGPLSASSTLSVAGLSDFGGFLSTASSTIVGGLRVAGATSTIQTALGVGSTTPRSALTAETSGTTTLSLDSTANNTGGCIQLKSSLSTAGVGIFFRIQATTTGFLIAESGTCQ